MEKVKFDVNSDIIYDIEMMSYAAYNDKIACMNDHLGEIYGYTDVDNMEKAQLEYEKNLAYQAIKQLQSNWRELKEFIFSKAHDPFDEYDDYDMCKLYDIMLDIEKGKNNED